MTIKTDRFRSLAVLAARCADDKLAAQIVLRRIGEASPLADYFLVASVESRAQMEAVQEHIRLTLKAEGYAMVHRDGPNSDLWRIMDYGGLLVHIMSPQTREFYSIDKLFHEGKKVPWEPRTKAAAPARKSPRKKKTAA